MIRATGAPGETIRSAREEGLQFGEELARVLEVPIAKVYPLAQVREAYTELERRHTRGKIVLRP